MGDQSVQPNPPDHPDPAHAPHSPSMLRDVILWSCGAEWALQGLPVRCPRFGDPPTLSPSRYLADVFLPAAAIVILVPPVCKGERGWEMQRQLEGAGVDVEGCWGLMGH